jgi:uncharacterized protein
LSESWRVVIRHAMKSASERELAAGAGGSEISGSSSFNYRLEHVSAVATLAQRLGKMLGADLDILEAAAWLHDVTKTDGERHADTGAEYAREILSGTDFPAEKIEAVTKTIADHIGLWRDTPLTDLHSQILWDADKLSKLGLTFVIHLAGMAISKNQSVSSADLVRMGQEADWQGKTVNSLHTAPARRAAQDRLSAFSRFWEDLNQELEGEDLQ